MTTKKFIGLCWAAGLLLAANCSQAQVVSLTTNLTAHEEQIIAAAKADAAPWFNGARLIGTRPGTPFLHSLAVTGVRPMTFSAGNLPVCRLIRKPE